MARYNKLYLAVNATLVYFNQLSNAALTQKLVKTFFWLFSTFPVVFREYHQKSTKKVENDETRVLTSLRVHAAPKNWLKYIKIVTLV